MRVLLRDTGPNGKAFPGCGEAFVGKTALEIVLAMKDASPFTAERTVDEHIQTVLRGAGEMLGVTLKAAGKTPEDRATSFISVLIEHGLAELRPDHEKPVEPPIAVPAAVWQGIEAVRQSGLTNMLDRPAVARITGQLGFPEAARFIKASPKEYAEGIFRGFVVASAKGGKR